MVISRAVFADLLGYYLDNFKILSLIILKYRNEKDQLHDIPVKIHCKLNYNYLVNLFNLSLNPLIFLRI